MATTYESIATVNGTGSSGTITFNSFSGYTDLILVTNAMSTASQYNAGLRFNGDTGTNYSRTSLSFDLATVTSNRVTNDTSIRVTSDGIVSGNPSTHILQKIGRAHV